MSNYGNIETNTEIETESKNTQKSNEYIKEWKKKNPDKARAIQKKWVDKNRTRINEYNREWRRKNPEKIRESLKKSQDKRTASWRVCSICGSEKYYCKGMCKRCYEKNRREKNKQK